MGAERKIKYWETEKIDFGGWRRCFSWRGVGEEAARVEGPGVNKTRQGRPLSLRTKGGKEQLGGGIVGLLKKLKM